MSEIPVNPTSLSATWESRLPDWQQKFNVFCENWIFAFLVAMAIRHVVLEAFRIPSASMEPILYGDPGLMKGDFVVVDKLFCRFSGVKRWDVTVFQYPLPEIEAPGNDARPAIDYNGDRLDVPMLRPLMYRNFIKRAVILPGDTFYIRSGNIYLKQPDGSFQASRRPAEIQEILWQEVYCHGAQAGYLPWEASSGASVTASGESLSFTCSAGGVALFTQPMRNLYMKPGFFKIRPAVETNPEGDELIELSMTKPVFTYPRSHQIGNAWDMDQWNVSRMNSADLDNKSQGTLLNNTMDEWVKDVRLVATVTKLEGNVDITMQADNQIWRLTLVPAGWQLTVNGTAVTQGVDVATGAELSFVHLDDQVIVSIGGKEVCRQDVPQVDPHSRVRISVSGNGHVTLNQPRIHRDIHYCQRGFMDEQATQKVLHYQRVLDGARNSLLMDSLQLDQNANRLDLISQVRAQMLGKPVDSLTSAERVAVLGTGPGNAITAPAGAYLMMGDNSPQSFDGREWGWVPAENIRGRALIVAFPPGRWKVIR